MSLDELLAAANVGMLAFCSVQADTRPEQNESQATDIELGGPELQEAASAAEASTSNAASTSEARADGSSIAPAESTTNGAPPKDSNNDNASGKRASAPSNTEDKSLPPSKRTRTAPPGGAQRRLFGVLTKTLSKFQEETKKDTEAVSGPSIYMGLSSLAGTTT